MPRLIFALLVLAAAVVAPAQTTDGKKSLVPDFALREVRKTKFRVLVPTYVPAGYVVDFAGLKKDKEPILNDWSIAYVNRKTKTTITVQMASEGLGDPIFDLPTGGEKEKNGSIWAQSPILGKVEVMWATKGSLKMAACTWYKTKTKTYPRYAMIMSEGVDAKEIKKMIEGLRWLK